MNREDYKRLLLSGTITFPATHPRSGQLSVEKIERLPLGGSGSDRHEMLVVKEQVSARVKITRSLPISDARAVFVPRDPGRFNLNDGTWLLGSEITEGLSVLSFGNRAVMGVAYVTESAPTLLRVDAGMAAAESAQYYPPVPSDRSVNPYESGPVQTAGSASARAAAGVVPVAPGPAAPHGAVPAWETEVMCTDMELHVSPGDSPYQEFRPMRSEMPQAGPQHFPQMCTDLELFPYEYQDYQYQYDTGMCTDMELER